MITYIIIILVLAGILAYAYYLHSGKIEDKDKDFIPDELERRAERVKEELKDIKDAAKNVVDQTKDIKDAVKGKPRRGRKAK